LERSDLISNGTLCGRSQHRNRGQRLNPLTKAQAYGSELRSSTGSCTDPISPWSGISTWL